MSSILSSILMSRVRRIISVFKTNSLLNSMYRLATNREHIIFDFNLPIDVFKLRPKFSNKLIWISSLLLLHLQLKFKKVFLWKRIRYWSSKDNLTLRSNSIVALCSLSIYSFGSFLLNSKLVLRV